MFEDVAWKGGCEGGDSGEISDIQVGSGCLVFVVVGGFNIVGNGKNNMEVIQDGISLYGIVQ